jgi:CubicO group peptidase (beta-lactamase class C family)
VPDDFDRLLEEAAGRGTSALAVVREGAVVLDWGPFRDQAIELMSCTKLAVAVLLGAVLGDLAVEEIDTPLCDLVPEWDGLARSVTIASLLSHQSGLRAVPAFEVYSAQDMIEQALGLDHDSALEGRHAYNNSAINLVGGLVQQLTGRPLHEAAEPALKALGWEQWRWATDSVANARCFAGLEARAADAARLVDLLVSDPQGLLPPGWADAVRSRGLSCYGEPAWIRAEITADVLDEWFQGGVDPALVDAIRPLAGRTMDFDEYFAELERALAEANVQLGLFGSQVAGAGLRRAHVTSGGRVAYGHDGDGGQLLMILPDQGASACRLRITGEGGSGGPTMWSSSPGAISDALNSYAS